MVAREKEYFQSTFGRINFLRIWFYSFFISIASYPRLIIEVFTRKDFGQRYFRLSSVITVAILLLFLRQIPAFIADIFGGGYYSQTAQTGLFDSIRRDPLWYLFCVAFIAVSIKRYQELDLDHQYINTNRFSLSYGEVNPFFYKIKIPGVETTLRRIEIFYEPLTVLALGLILILFDQSLGWLLTICSIIYSFSYMAHYRMGDNGMLDTVDSMISNKGMSSLLDPEFGVEEYKGFRHRGRIPKDDRTRQKFKDRFDSLDDDEGDEVK